MAGITLVAPTRAAVNIDLVTVGNPGNSSDPATGYGAVAYEYKIATNETTIGQYCEFLNAIAKTDTYELYSTYMVTQLNSAGIIRSGVSGGYTYSVIGSANRPITFVGWFDAARFCNWMHNGQPVGLQNALTTESGAYSLLGALSGVGFSVQAGAKFWIPSENEWYKAAYYDPTKNGGNGGYWLYPTRSDTMTSNSIGVAGAANHWDGDYATTQNGFPSPSQNYLTEVGAYGTGSQSYYGTNDQGGNVYEWNDAVMTETSRGIRGGSWMNSGIYTSSSKRTTIFSPSGFGVDVGFRVASVPESGTLAMTGLFGSALLLRRKRVPVSRSTFDLSMTDRLRSD